MQSKELAGLVSQIRNNIPLTRVVESLGMTLSKGGTNFKTYCPFNTHSRPTVELYDATNAAQETAHYHCFACGAHGDVFDLVKQVKSTDFNGAVDWLASNFGLSSPVNSGRSNIKKGKKTLRVENPYVLALQIYQKSSNREKTLLWLRERAIPEAFYEKAEIVFAGKLALSREMASDDKEIELRPVQDQLESVGLIRRDVQVDPYLSQHLDLSPNYRDFFYDERIIFPIRDVNGILLGFAGRLYGNAPTEKTPKYLYTPKLPKSEVLYRGDVALSSLRKKNKSSTTQYRDLYICEGLVDTLRLESFGFAAVGILGSQISDSQVAVIVDMARQMSSDSTLRCFVFLDRDSAGIRGAAKTLKLLLANQIQSVFVWATDSKKKDPDEILKDLTVEEAVVKLAHSVFPPALVILANALNVHPDEILNEDSWADISIGKRFQEARILAKSRTEELFVLYAPFNNTPTGNARWLKDVEEFRSNNESGGRDFQKAITQAYIQDSTARLNHARSLAKAGAQRGEVPSDEAAWRRIDIAATTFNEILKSKLSQRIFSPLEPFDAVLVSRGFGKDEPRVKAMPCPEDLIVQQYILNELLTERLDSTVETPFSRFVPAVRYYRDKKRTITTAESETGGEKHQTLSFAYQIDMDVIEGTKTASDQGMFRPYFECWRDFNASLHSQSKKMPIVHMVRLDLSRYYDNLSRSTVRNSLKLPLNRAFATLDETGKVCAELFLHDAHRADSLTDWLCDQSFGYAYYSPYDGSVTVKPGSEYIGVPQGPVLSAWLATVALFPLDSAIRSLLEQINTLDEVHIGYARYVDDIVLLADTPERLSLMRATAEDAIARLQLSITQKGDRIPPLSAEKFSELLSSGKAIAGSGPTWEPDLVSGADNFVNTDQIGNRVISLALLSDSVLYITDEKDYRDRLFTALQANDLRPGDLARATSKIWYLVAKEISDHSGVRDVSEIYWKEWDYCVSGVEWTLECEENPWDDPSFYALEGLEILIRSTHYKPFGLDDDQELDRKATISRLAKVTLSQEFCRFFDSTRPKSSAAGKGVIKLNRMFWQRYLMLRWKVLDILPENEKNKSNQLSSNDRRTLHTFHGSLIRAAITEVESSGKDMASIAQSGGHSIQSNPLRSATIWIHHAIALFKIEKLGQNDPLAEISRALEQDVLPDLLNDIAGKSEVLADLLRYLLPENLSISEFANVKEWPEANTHSRSLALSTLTAISIRERLLDNLKRRQRLLNPAGIGRLQPSLPGVSASALILIEPAKRDEYVDNIWQVAAISLISVEGNASDVIAQVKLRESTASSAAENVITNWSEVQNSNDHLLILKSGWNAKAKDIHIKPPEATNIEASTLWFASALFNALARINYALAISTDHKLEYVPAWPYIAFEQFRDKDGANGKYFSMLCPPVHRAHLGNLAFIRDGFRGLRTVQVNGLENAWLWRIGFAVTDILGLVDDLDHHKTEINDRQNEAELSSFDPAKYVLRAVLQRLRGKYAERVSKTREGQHLPGSLERCLSLLNGYPANGSQEENTWYALAVDWENRAMACRIENLSQLDGRGEACHFLYMTTTKVFTSLPLSWSDALPPVQTTPGSTYRRGVSSWIAIAERVKFLNTSGARTRSTGLENSSATINSGLRISAVVHWIRSLALELYGMNVDPTAASIDLAATWGIEGAILVSGHEDNDVLSTFETAIRSRRTAYRLLEKITPIGWLTLVSFHIGLFNPVIPGGASFDAKLSEKIACLASDLAPIVQAEESDDSWPFENIVNPSKSVWGDDFLSRSLETLQYLDAVIGNSVTLVDHVSWGYDPIQERFRDAYGSTWSLNGWRINQLSWEKHIEEYLSEQVYRKVWTETRNSKNELIGISVLGQRFSRFSSMQKSAPSSKVQSSYERVPNVEEAQEDSDIERDSLKSASDSNEDQKLDVAHNEERVTVHVVGMGAEGITPTDYIALPFSKALNWQSFQTSAWAPRQAKASSHARIAFLQFRVDDSYYHPLNEVGWPSVLEDALNKKGKVRRKKNRASRRAKLGDDLHRAENLLDALAVADGGGGEEWKWTAAQVLPSWAEHRRRRILLECLKSCESFKADTLVVPEYSLRPDTIAWLKRWMEIKSCRVAVVAGTYRLHGRPSDGNFKQRFEGIFGDADHSKIFGQDPTLSMEKTAYITLLAPQEFSKIGRFVGVFSRAKKYPSVAMGEFFRPGVDIWSPLFTLDKLVDFVEYFHPSRDGSPVVTAKDILKISNEFIPLRNMAELICSELFLPTSPANWPSIASEYKKLLVHFGIQKTSAEAYKIVRKDLDALAMAMSPSGFSEDGSEHHCLLPRRSILIVPALTSRSADYWIYGQSALLSAGVTTIFCTGTGKGLSGGSCIIGRKSWDHKGTGKVGVHDHITPYAGWSRGIYYNGPEDALGKEEQALVIADIDPSHMLEGRPRPQVLPVPLQLVAHLPIIESVDAETLLSRCSDWTGEPGEPLRSDLELPLCMVDREKLAELAEKIRSGNIASLIAAEQLGRLISKIGQGRAFSDRLNHWRNNSRDMPSSQPSPALVDWIWVDLTPNFGKVADVFIPPWGEDH